MASIVASTGLSPTGPSSWTEARKLRDHWIAGIRREGSDFVDRRTNKNTHKKPATFKDSLRLIRSTQRCLEDRSIIEAFS